MFRKSTHCKNKNNVSSYPIPPSPYTKKADNEPSSPTPSCSSTKSDKRGTLKNNFPSQRTPEGGEFSSILAQSLFIPSPSMEKNTGTHAFANLRNATSDSMSSKATAFPLPKVVDSPILKPGNSFSKSTLCPKRKTHDTSKRTYSFDDIGIFAEQEDNSFLSSNRTNGVPFLQNIQDFRA